jgi:hypothetical protein
LLLFLFLSLSSKKTISTSTVANNLSSLVTERKKEAFLLPYRNT